VYQQLNAAQKRAARRAFALFMENPGHNSLQFGKRTGDTIEWAWIGTHNEFDKLFG